MIVYFLYAPLNIICMILCYLTNPLVVLFANELGELPGFLKYWQTWDDSLNPRFYIKEKVPKFLRYDYDRHYEEYWDTDKKLKKLGRTRCYVKMKDPHFTIKERLQRYICRVMWLYRNCAYGFAFYCFGRRTIGAKCTRFEYDFDEQGHYIKYIGNTDQTPGNRIWMYKSTWPINKKYRWEIYLGWKINEEDNEPRHCMIANRIAIRKMK